MFCAYFLSKNTPPWWPALFFFGGGFRFSAFLPFQSFNTDRYKSRRCHPQLQMVRAAACAAHLGCVLQRNFSELRYLAISGWHHSEVEDISHHLKRLARFSSVCTEDMLSGGMGSGQLRIAIKKPKVWKRGCGGWKHPCTVLERLDDKGPCC